MQSFEFHRAADVRSRDRRGREIEHRAAGRQRPLRRGRHDACRPDEAQRRAARRVSSTSTGCRSTRSSRLPDGGLRIGATVRNSRSGAPSRSCSATTRCCRRRSSRRIGAAPEHGDDRRATCCSARAACTSATRRCRATSASPAPAARPSAETTATLAILGTSEHCIATNPSDMNVAMAALEATIHVQGAKGERSIRDRGLSPAARRARRSARRCSSPAI